VVTFDTDVELAMAGLQDMGPVVTLLGIDSVHDFRDLSLLGEVHLDSLEEVHPDSLEGDHLDNDRHLVFEVNLLDTLDQGIRMFL